MTSCAVFMDCATKIQSYHHYSTLNSIQRLIASRYLPLCDPGHHPNNERRRFARCRQIAQDLPDSPLLHHRLGFPCVHGRLRRNVRAFVLCSLFPSLTDGRTLLLSFKLHESRTGWCHPRHCTNSIPIGHVQRQWVHGESSPHAVHQ